MSGYVETEDIQASKSFKDLSHISDELQPEQIQTCEASSNWPQQGQLGDSFSFHLCINFPTPYIPTVCFEIKVHLDCEDRAIALHIAFQLIDENCSAVTCLY